MNVAQKLGDFWQFLKAISDDNSDGFSGFFVSYFQTFFHQQFRGKIKGDSSHPKRFEIAYHQPAGL